MKAHSTMGTWKLKTLNKGARASREAGRKKGLVPPAWARHCARSGRSYKHPDYARWDAICDGGKVKWSNN